MDASQEFARYFASVKYEDLPTAVCEAVKTQILDFIGIALAGYSQDGARQMREMYLEFGGAPQATVIGLGAKLPAPNAAHCNATMAHTLDYDDVHEAAIMHPGVITIPTALAMAEYRGGLTGKELITAVAIGGDMISRMGLATRPGQNIHQFGWHFTSINGYMAGAAVAGRVLGLTEQEILYAIGIGYHQSAGNGQAVKDGVLTKRLGPGFAVRGGITAALLAARGVTGARNAFEGVNGYYKVYHDSSYSREKLVGGLGAYNESINISIKPYPCCRGIHPFIDAALNIRAESDAAPGDIASIEIWCGKGTQELLGEPLSYKAKPRNVVDAQFSLAWGVSTALVYGTPGLKHFTKAAIADPEILSTAAKVSITYEPAFDSGGLEPARVKVTLNGGREYVSQVEIATGSPEKPTSFGECARKFRDSVQSTEMTLPAENIGAIIDTVHRLDECSDVREILPLAVWE